MEGNTIVKIFNAALVGGIAGAGFALVKIHCMKKDLKIMKEACRKRDELAKLYPTSEEVDEMTDKELNETVFKMMGISQKRIDICKDEIKHLRDPECIKVAVRNLYREELMAKKLREAGSTIVGGPIPVIDDACML